MLMMMNTNNTKKIFIDITVILHLLRLRPPNRYHKAPESGDPLLHEQIPTYNPHTVYIA